MQLLKQGAEAKIYSSEYLGKKCIVKRREQKTYREKNLDESILKERIRSECNLLARAKNCGVRTPVIWKTDFEKMEITTEFIDGKTLKEKLTKGKDKSEAIQLSCMLGKEVGKLHSAGIIHGDLTTSNVILHKGKLVFLDFGLGKINGKIEDKATDFLCLKKMFLATHFSIKEQWKTIEECYIKEFSGGSEVLKQMHKAEARARYY